MASKRERERAPAGTNETLFLQGYVVPNDSTQGCALACINTHELIIIYTFW